MSQETKICQNCKQEFRIEPEDFLFYDKIQVPPPTFCPECRMVRRMIWRNERTLYKRKCDAPSHNEDIISVYSPDKPFIVYDRDYWWSDKWNPIDYGRDYDFSKSFFAQFRELLEAVPAQSLTNTNPINSQYVNSTLDCKDCYLLFGAQTCENCNYANYMDACKDCFDLYRAAKCELCYMNIFCNESSRLAFSEYSTACLESMFLSDCRNCSKCFGAVSLRNKQHIFFNEQLTKEEYLKKINRVDAGSFKNLAKLKEDFENLNLRFPKRFARTVHSNNVTGDNIKNSKNCKDCFDVLVGGAEDCKDIMTPYGETVRDSRSCTFIGNGAELCYEAISCNACSNVYFSKKIWTGYNVFYSYNCFNSNNLFSCIGLRNKEYCILNKQYTKEEYEKLVPKIIEHMNTMPYISKTRINADQNADIRRLNNNISVHPRSNQRESAIVYKYGEFFPPELSPFAYNETIAQEYFPLTKEQSIEKGYSWKDPEERNLKPDLTPDQLPDHIKDVPDSIVGKVIQCQHAVSQINADQNADQRGSISVNPRTHQRVSASTCNEQCTTAFKIIAPELEFYRRMNLPLPRYCPNCRHYARLKQRNPLKLWHRKCTCAGEKSENGVYQNTIKHFHGESHCPNEFETTYAPDRPEIVYCEQCYQAEVV